MADLISGMLFEGKSTNIFIKRVTSDAVVFIEGFSPLGIHDIQEIPKENFWEYVNTWGFVQNGFWD